MIQLTEVIENTAGKYMVRSVYINPTQVVMVREDVRLGSIMAEGKLDLGFTPNMRFSRITVRGGTSNYDVVVAGDPTIVYEKVNTSKTLLKG
jgi:hypothetical protein